MAKKSKAVRQYNKQLQKLKKIEKKAKQKGIDIDLSTPKSKETKVEKKDVADIKRKVNKANNLLNDKGTKNKNLTLTNKQLLKAVHKRQQRLKPVKPITASYEKEDNRSNEELKLSQKQLAKAIKKRKQRQVTENRKKYTPEEPKQEYQDNINEGDSFFVDTVIRNYLEEISYYPSKAQPILQQWLNSLIDKYGKEDVATMLQEGAEDGVVLTREIAYDGEKLQGYISDMLDYLPEMTDWGKEDILDAFDDWVNIE